MARLQVLGVHSVEARAQAFVVTLEVDRPITKLEAPFLEALGDDESWAVTAQGILVLVGAASAEDVKRGVDTLLRQGLRVVEMQVVDRERDRSRLDEEVQALLAHFADE